MRTDEQKADVWIGTDASALAARLEAEAAKVLKGGPIWGEGETVAAIREAATTITELQDLNDRLKLEAQCHAGEARCANSTIYEIYQVLTGATGEPGNWNGAEPARKYVAAQQATITALQERIKELEGALAGKWRPIDTAPKDGTEFDVWAVNDEGQSRRICEVSWGPVADWTGKEWDDWIGMRPSLHHARFEPTHWQPLPIPPTLKDSGNGSEVAR